MNLGKPNVSHLENVPSLDSCAVFFSNYDSFSSVSLAVFGFFMNLISIVMFILTKSYKNTTFAYLLLKSIFDAVHLLIRAIDPLFTCKACSFTKNQSFLIFTLVFQDYLALSSLLCSMFCDIAAHLDRYILLSQNFLFCKKISIKISVFLMILYSSLFYVYKLLAKNVVQILTKQKNNTTIISYSLVPSGFYYSEAFNYFDFTHSFVRDVLCIAILFILNGLILVIFKRSMQNKKKLASSGKSQKAEKAEKNLTIMIVVIGVVTMIGHIPAFIKYLPLPSINTNGCITYTKNVLFKVSMSVNVFFFFYFNNTFKKTILVLISRLLSICGVDPAKIYQISETERSLATSKIQRL